MRLDWATGLTGLSGPFATVALDASRNEAAADHEVKLRWESHARRLAELGAPEEIVKALGEALLVPTGRGGAAGRLAVATADGVVLDLVLPEPPVRETTTWGPIPHLIPGARALHNRLSFVLAEVDRTGADLHVVTPWGETTEVEVTGDDDELHRFGGGGWSHYRFQHRVIDSEERNAEEVAAELEKVAREHKPDLVLVAGDDRAVGKLLESVSGHLTDHLVRLRSGGRAGGNHDTALQAEIADAVAGVLRERRAALLDRFAAAEARQDTAVQSVPDVVSALQRGQVDELLLVDNPTSNLTLWSGGRPEALAVDRDDLEAMGVSDAHRVRADAAILWALVGTGAGITIFDDFEGGNPENEDPAPRLRDGIGATLRWDDASTPHDAAPSMPGHGE